MQKSLSIIVPSVPNFLLIGDSTDEKRRITIPVEEFSDSELKKIGKEWTEKLLEEAAKKRK